MSIQDNLLVFQNNIQSLSQKNGLKEIRLLAVSKTQPVDKILEAYAAGQRLFGENYLQEAEEKITALSEKDIEWHFIGSIQSNKTKKIAQLFDWVQSVDSSKIAQRLNDQRPTELGPLNICIEVNLNAESSKAGISNEELIELVTFCQTLPMLKLRGLMAIPQKTADKAAQRRAFKSLRENFDALNHQGFELDTLSMGMSGDYEAAIAEGSNMIRIGTAIFGARPIK